MPHPKYKDEDGVLYPKKKQFQLQRQNATATIVYESKTIDPLKLPKLTHVELVKIAEGYGIKVTDDMKKKDLIFEIEEQMALQAGSDKHPGDGND